MENQENKNLNELEQLKAQYETLKQQFEQQEIVNDRLMKSSIRHGIDFYQRYRWRQYIIYPLFTVLGLMVIRWKQNSDLSLMLFWLSYCSVCFVMELLMMRKLRIKSQENNDLFTLLNDARSFKKLFSIFTVLNYFLAFLIVSGVLMYHIGSLRLPNLGMSVIVLCSVIVVFICLGLLEVHYKTRPCDEIIRQIEVSEVHMARKKGFDWKQKLFCIAMIIVFAGFDVWVSLIGALYLKMPPMWHTEGYWRAADDVSTEGKLAVWEIYDDTIVSASDVPVIMECWKHGDSIVVMKGPLVAEMELSDGKVNYCEYEKNCRDGVKLYALKKCTPEGPAISSDVLCGKPMVKNVFVNKPRKYPSIESVPIITEFTPEASRLWFQLTDKIKGHYAALSMDGEVVQEWIVKHEIDNGFFFIMKKWQSEEELETFCRRLVRQ